MAHRREMLDAARRVFGRRGFDRATMDEIAEEAGFAKGTFYQHFKDKTALFIVVIEEDFNELIKAMDEAMAAADGAAEIVKGCVTAELKYFERRKEFYDIFVSHWPTSFTGEIDALRQAMLKRVEELTSSLARHLKRGVDKGEIKPYDVRLLATLLMGMASSYSYEVLTGKANYSIEEAAETIANIYMDGVRADR